MEREEAYRGATLPLLLMAVVLIQATTDWQREWEEIKCTHALPYFIYTIDKFKEKPVTNGFELMPHRTPGISCETANTITITTTKCCQNCLFTWPIPPAVPLPLPPLPSFRSVCGCGTHFWLLPLYHHNYTRERTCITLNKYTYIKAFLFEQSTHLFAYAHWCQPAQMIHVWTSMRYYYCYCY